MKTTKKRPFLPQNFAIKCPCCGATRFVNERPRHCSEECEECTAMMKANPAIADWVLRVVTHAIDTFEDAHTSTYVHPTPDYY